jgi:hypothetical protein
MTAPTSLRESLNAKAAFFPVQLRNEGDDARQFANVASLPATRGVAREAGELCGNPVAFAGN